MPAVKSAATEEEEEWEVEDEPGHKSKLLRLSRRADARRWGFFQLEARLAKTQAVVSRLTLAEVRFSCLL
jgi:hypothetical protein